MAPTLHALWDSPVLENAPLSAHDSDLLVREGIHYPADSSWSFPHAALRGGWFVFGFDGCYPLAIRITNQTIWMLVEEDAPRYANQDLASFLRCMQRYLDSISRDYISDPERQFWFRQQVAVIDASATGVETHYWEQVIEQIGYGFL